MGDFNSILLKRQFEVPLDIEILVTSLSSKLDDDFTVRKINEYNFDVIAYSSFGILRGPFGQVTDGIKVYVNFAPGHEKKTLVTLGTNFRIELYFAIFISLCLGMAGALNQIFPFWAYFFFPFMILFFWIVYRIQENTLANDVEDYLSKQPRMGWKDLK